MKRLLASSAIIASLLLLPLVALAAGTATFSVTYEDSKYLEVQFVVTSHTDGSVDSPTISDGTGTAVIKHGTPLTGRIDRVIISPGAGAAQPTDAFDVELRSTTSGNTGVDYLGGLGDNLSNSAAKMDMPLTETNQGVVMLAGDVLTPYAANCGDSNQYTIKVLIAKK